jgi:large subunit ribosomal protein L9
MAILATPSARKVLAEEVRQQAFKQEKIRKEATELAQVLEGLSLRIPAKAAETGKIYGSVNNVQIANAIKEAKDLTVDRKQIIIKEDSIKEVGTYKAVIRLHKEVSVEISFEVFAE